jgi:hypothetical protein
MAKGTFALVLISTSRLIPLYYFTCYRGNVKECCSPFTFVMVSVYLGVQLLIILLQNWCGGAFFLPKRLTPVWRFDYRAVVSEEGAECSICSTRMEAGEDAMVTPCSHSFHAKCLTRWMEIEMMCPLCRDPLPVIDETTLRET